MGCPTVGIRRILPPGCQEDDGPCTASDADQGLRENTLPEPSHLLWQSRLASLTFQKAEEGLVLGMSSLLGAGVREASASPPAQVRQAAVC